MPSDTSESFFSESVATEIVEAVADREDVDPTDLPRLYDVVDPDAVDALFERPDPGSAGGPLRLTVTYHDYEVEVRRSGRVLLTPVEPRLPK